MTAEIYCHPTAFVKSNTLAKLEANTGRIGIPVENGNVRLVANGAEHRCVMDIREKFNMRYLGGTPRTNPRDQAS